jgi:hypothetical protein
MPPRLNSILWPCFAMSSLWCWLSPKPYFFECTSAGSCASVAVSGNLICITIAAAAAAGLLRRAKHKTRELSFDNCAEAKAFLVGRLIAGTEVDVNFHSDVVGHGTDAANRQTTKLKLTFTPGPIEMTMPDISWPNMSDADRVSLDRALKNLQTHEEGHVAVAADAMRGFNRVIEVSGSSKAEIAAAVQKATVEVKAAVLGLQEQYDAITAHGAKQSAAIEHGLPPGDDVVFTCSD